MITKIVSGGQTGAHQAALDVAIEEGIPHGGWIQKGRSTDGGTLPEKYQLKETATDSPTERTEKNVVDSDGTVMLCHGKLSEGSAFTQEMAEKHGRPFLHINLHKVNAFKAAEDISNWITQCDIKVLNVTGPEASRDPGIYEAVKKVLTTVLYLDHIRAHMPDPERLHPHLPRTVAEAVEYLQSELPLKDMALIAKMAEEELSYLHPTLGEYVRSRFGLLAENRRLMQSCRLRSGKNLDEDECSAFIVRELWKKLQASHRLRAVK
jgi:hypothetical protein